MPIQKRVAEQAVPLVVRLAGRTPVRIPFPVVAACVAAVELVDRTVHRAGIGAVVRFRVAS